ncbi:MAG TPA: MBG domain-containing protein [Opitutaceae bacterium]|nr:MBG domain-containing protein [Opitutaceae bacterium]
MKTIRFTLAFSLALLTSVLAHATIGAGFQMQLGNPSGATADPDNHQHYLLQRDQYALDYNDSNGEPNWVSWDLTVDDLGSSGRSNNFIPDPNLSSTFYALVTGDYTGSGYDRGHMCPSADRTITAADNQQTFILSNILPQAPDNNQGVWANFEGYCRTLASAGNEVLITSGGSGYGGSRIPSGKAAIPGYTWKIAVVVPAGSGSAVSRITASTRVIAIKIPNVAGVRSTPWENFITSVAQIEADTGFTFFTTLPAAVASQLRTVVDGQSAAGAPAFVTQPSLQTTVVGGSATFSVTASGDAPLTYQWLHDDEEIDGATDATLNLANVQAPDAGNYYAVVTNNVGSATSNAAALVITGLPPSIATPPAPQDVSAGSNVTFSVTAGGSPTLTYQWRKDGNPIGGATATLLALANVQSGDIGSYDVVVTNSVGSVTSMAVSLTVNPAAPTITGQPAAKTASTGGNASFTVTASGSETLSYQWRKDGLVLSDGGVISGSATATLLLTGVAAVDGGSYDVVVTNTLGFATSNTATLTVNPPPPNQVIWDFGPAATPTAAPSSGLGADITGGVITQGNNNGTTPLITTTSASSPLSTFSGANNAGAAARIGALVQNGTATTGSAYFEFTLAPSAGKRLLVSALSLGMRSTGTGPQAYAMYSSLDGFTAAVASGTIANDSNWHLLTPAFTTVTGATGAPVTFRLFGYNGAGSAGANTANWRIDDLKLTVNAVFPPPVPPVVTATSPLDGATGVAVTAPITVTFNEAVSFTGSWFNLTSASQGPLAAAVTGGPTTYTLTPPSMFANTDTITVNILGAQVVDQASGTIHGSGTTTFAFTTEVFVPPTPPAVTTQPTSQTVNVGASATFTVAASGTPPFTYQWRKGGAAITGNSSATTASLTLTGVTTAAAGSYDCVVSNAAGSDVSHPATLNVVVVPPSITAPPAGQIAAVGGTATFAVAAGGTAPFTYQWRKDGVPLVDGGAVSGANTATLTLTGVSATDSGAYDVIVTNAGSAVTSAAATLAVTSAAPGAIYWDFATANPTSGVPAGVTGGTVTQGNNSGTTTLITAVSISSGYTGVSGGNNAGAAARVGALVQNGTATTGSAYFEFTFTPPAGRQFAATGLSFGTRSTGTGPQAFAVYTSIDGFAAPVASGAIANDSVWRLLTPAFAGAIGAPGAPVTFRLYGCNGAGSAGANTANWRIDDLKLTAGVLALPAFAPAVIATAPLDGATNVPVNSAVTVTFNQAVSVSGASFTLTSAAHGPLPAVGSGGPETFTLTPAAPFDYGDTITVTVVGGQVTEQATGTLTLPADYSFSFATVPPIAPTIDTAPVAQTATAGDSVSLSVAAGGTPAPSYQWRKGGEPIAGNPSATTPTLTFAPVTTADAGSYDCVIANAGGTVVTEPVTLTVNKAAATVAISGLSQTYNGGSHPVGVITSPAGLAVAVTYGGGTSAPVNAGSYAVVATVVDANFAGSASGTLVVAPAPAALALTGLTVAYDGAPHAAGVTTTPAGLAVTVTYDGSTAVPVNAGNYAVIATLANPNYAAAPATGTLTIAKTTASLALSGLSAIYNGAPHLVTATTTPAGLGVSVTYDGSPTPPVNAGSYAVVATLTNPNYTAVPATGTLTIAKAAATLALGDLHQAYDGTPKSVTVTTDPAGLSGTLTYNGSSTPPTAPGSYTVVATSTDPNYTGTVTDTLVISIGALVRHGPALNGGLDGSLQVLLPESTTLNGSAWVSGDLLVPGTPTVQLNGHPAYGGTINGTGAASPSNYTITLNGNALLRHVVRQTDAIALPAVAAPPAPAGTRSVSINAAGQPVGDFATLRNLTLNTNGGQVAVPAGTYGTFTANGSSGFVFGDPNATEPVVYNLQGLTLNGTSRLTIVGPVVLNLAGGVSLNGTVTTSGHPEWLALNLAAGGLTLNGSVTFEGFVTAPAGTVTINGSSELDGGVAADRLTINGNGLLKEE